MKNKFIQFIGLGGLGLMYSCAPTLSEMNSSLDIPSTYTTAIQTSDTTGIGGLSWGAFYQDTNLRSLINEGLRNNQELRIVEREVNQLRNEVDARKGEYLPQIGLQAGANSEKPGRFTRNGAVEEQLLLNEGAFPEPLPHLSIRANASWEVDIWKRLRNAKNAARERFLAGAEGQQFMKTQLVAEIAEAYYELIALDRKLAIAEQNVQLQRNALQVVQIQKQTAKVTELAVKRFEAQLAGTESLLYELKQEIIEQENRINLLVGRYPQPISRDVTLLDAANPPNLPAGQTIALLQNRPDIRQAEHELEATRLDVKSARARFYPALSLEGAIGLEAYKPDLLLRSPESLLYGLGGGLMAPLINRKAIANAYRNANERQIQALLKYEQSVLQAYLEVVNEQWKLRNLQQQVAYKTIQVERLNTSVEIANILFASARADYIEVLLTQEEALDTRFELATTKLEQLKAQVQMYRSLGGGWR